MRIPSAALITSIIAACGASAQVRSESVQPPAPTPASAHESDPPEGTSGYGDAADPSSTEALLRALAWRADETEEDAIAAARTLRERDLSDAEREASIRALDEAYARIVGVRATDNRMRIDFIRTLGHLRDSRATPTLARIATSRSETQSFLLNRLAAEQLAELGDPAAVGPMIEALFLFASDNPALRANDLAARALVEIGRPSLEPTLSLLRSENARATALAAEYVAAVRVRYPRAADGMRADLVVHAEATFVLGALGFREALPALLAEARSEDVARRTNAVLALARLNLEPSDSRDVRAAFESTSRVVDPQTRAQLTFAMRHAADAALLPLLLTHLRDRDEHPMVRGLAARNYALLVNASEARAMRRLIAREPGAEAGGLREELASLEPLLDAAVACDERLACWLDQLARTDGIVAEKACAMVARLARDDTAAIAVLTEALGHRDTAVRIAALFALDRVATRGAPAAIAKIDALEAEEEGRVSWNGIAPEATMLRARLRHRAP